MTIETHMPVVDDFGGAPFAEHDMACAVCWTRSAVLNLSEGRFEPCWSCQTSGWRLARRRRWQRPMMWWYSKGAAARAGETQ